MLVKSRRPWDLPYSEITPESIYRSRRDFMRLRALRPEIDAHIRAAAGERLKANSSEPGAAPSQ